MEMAFSLRTGKFLLIDWVSWEKKRDSSGEVGKRREFRILPRLFRVATSVLVPPISMQRII